MSGSTPSARKLFKGRQDPMRMIPLPAEAYEDCYHRRSSPLEEYPFEYFAQMDRNNRELHREPSGSRKCFNYIRYPWYQFSRIMGPHLKKASSFIDVGCGAGDKVYLAKKINPKIWACGVEVDHILPMWANALGLDNVWCVDAFKVNFSNWDLIYAY